MAKLRSLVVLLLSISVVGKVASVPVVGDSSSTASATNTAPALSNIDDNPTLVDFIRHLMKKYGEIKAAEALQSLDQLPLGLTMKVLLVEVDKTLATDIVAMQRYAQSSDKSLIMMIGKIVAGDKNVPKEIFAMDQKLLKFPWWVRIRQRMFSNLEKYIAAYSLVPVATKAALKGAKKVETPDAQDINRSELAAAVAASATETSVIKQELAPAIAAHSAPAVNADTPKVPFRISLLTPVQQQQVLEALAGIQSQQLQQQTNDNPGLVV